MSDIKLLVKELTAKHGRSTESLLPILQDILIEERVISEDAMVEVARELDISAAEVYGTATFYSFLGTKPIGKYVIRVCKTITCMMHGKNQIVKEIEELLKIKPGETTLDKKFTFLETNCLGQCHEGPAMLVNDTPYTKLTPERVKDIINRYRIDEIPLN
jgi:NADH:ubiquinone oxidoreductase subunit E